MPKIITDILVYIALKEEFEYIYDSIDIDLVPMELKDDPLIVYTATISSKVSERDYNIVFAPVGGMGNTTSASNCQILIKEFNPKNIVVFGIAGSISADLVPGDVFIPAVVVEYLANSAVEGEEIIEIKNSPSNRSTDARLLNRFKNLSIRSRILFKNWQGDTSLTFSNHISDEKRNELESLGVSLRTKAKFEVADNRNLGSGSIVGKRQAFADMIKKIDRKIVAVEMEAAGVYTAATAGIEPPRVITIRGISDIVMEKEGIENIVGDELRKVCIKNAIGILKLAIEQDVFKEEKKITSLEEVNDEIALASTIKKVFIVGGVADSESNSDDSVEVLRESCKIIGSELAKSNMDLIVCSPFTDSADYYAALGYNSEEKNGKIYFHFPNNSEVINRLDELKAHLEESNGNNPKIIRMRYANYFDKSLRKEAWNICQIQALQDADAVVAIGGRESSSANLLLHLAELWNKPIIPFSIVGGAALKAYERIDWDKLYPNIPKNFLTDRKKIKNVVDILHRMSLENVAREVEDFGQINTAFLSRATLDALHGDKIRKYLESKNISILLGDDAIVPEKEVIPAINEFMAQSQLFIALWSKNYALSTWCHDELMFAISRQEAGLVKIVLILLDETPIIPTEARGLIQINKTTLSEVNITLNQILKLD